VISGNIVRRLVFASFLSTQFAIGLLAQAPKAVDITYSLATDRLNLHEPVTLSVNIHNNGPESITLSLGQDRKAGYLLLLTPPDGLQVKLRKPEHGGISIPGDVLIPSGETFTQTLVLNEWYDFRAPGEYRLDVRIVQPLLVGKAATQVRDDGFKGKLLIRPRDAARLTELCEHLAAQIKNTENLEKAAEPALKLSYISDPVAVPFLHQAIDQQPMLAFIFIPGLKRIGNDEAVGVLLSSLKSPREMTAAFAMSALIELQDKITNSSLKETVRRTLSQDVPAHRP